MRLAKKDNNVDDPDLYFDKNHDNVKQLSLFGYTPKNIDDCMGYDEAKS